MLIASCGQCDEALSIKSVHGPQSVRAAVTTMGGTVLFMDKFIPSFRVVTMRDMAKGAGGGG